MCLVWIFHDFSSADATLDCNVLLVGPSMILTTCRIQLPTMSSGKPAPPYTFETQSGAWNELTMSMRHHRNETTWTGRDQTWGIVLPRLWSSQKEWKNQIFNQFSESQSSTWTARVSSHNSRGDFPAGWQLCVCYKSQLKHGIPPHDFRSVSLQHPHSSNILFYKCTKLPMGVMPATEVFKSRMVSVFADTDLKSQFHTLMTPSFPRGTHLKSILQTWRKLLYNWVTPDSKFTWKRANSSGRRSNFLALY